MVEHDMQVGQLLDDMKKMGVLDNTIIVYTTDNGPEHSAKIMVEPHHSVVKNHDL